MGFEAQAEAAIHKLGKKSSALYRQLLDAHQTHGDEDALETARALVRERGRLTLAEKERLLGYLEGLGKTILTEPHSILTDTARMPGLDGEKMSNSGNNKKKKKKPKKKKKKKKKKRMIGKSKE